MSKLFIPVGIPGCGKSVFVDVVNHVNLRVVSSDAIREETTGDISNQAKNDNTFAVFHARIEDYLLDNLDVYADATNLTASSRANLRTIADRVGASTHLLLFTNLNEAVTRNRRRERVVPPEVMGKMLEKYEKTLKDIGQEQYNSITYIESVI